MHPFQNKFNVFIDHIYSHPYISCLVTITIFTELYINYSFIIDLLHNSSWMAMELSKGPLNEVLDEKVFYNLLINSAEIKNLYFNVYMSSGGLSLSSSQLLSLLNLIPNDILFPNHSGLNEQEIYVFGSKFVEVLTNEQKNQLGPFLHGGDQNGGDKVEMMNSICYNLWILLKEIRSNC